jgi:endonuclease-3
VVNTEEIIRILSKVYGGRTSGLNYNTPFELLVATILSAQCTDVRVNQVTSSLFQVYNTPAAFAEMTVPQLEEHIRTCGLYHAKAEYIIETSKRLLETYGGEVPADMDALLTLPGVGRKTANVVLSNAMGIPAIAVDTHVFRVSHRLGLADAPDAEGTEKQLMAVLPREIWSQAHHWLIWHGREICRSRKPACHICPLAGNCFKLIAGGK